MKQTLKGLLPILAILTLFSFSASAQKTNTHSGVVVDENSEPLPGVFVYDPANKNGGTMTDDKGKFNITVKPTSKELTFSIIGYKEQTLQFAKTALVKMEPDNEYLNEVVVTGIYTRKAESFTGAVQTVTNDQLKRISSSNVIQSLSTLDPSLLVIENLTDGANPNSMSSMQLRGASSFASESSSLENPNTPLFILDGFETTLEKIQDMDMNRIESITILKDASAKAIYGSKAGNGVIVIETKSLRNDKSAVTYYGSFEVEMPDLSSYNLCNALEKLEVENREGYYYKMASSSAELSSAMNLYNERLKKAMEGESTYWLSKPLRTALNHKHTLEIELGTKDLKNLINVSYKDNPGVMKGSYRRNISGDVSTSYRMGKWQFRNIMSFLKMDSQESPYGEFSEYAVLNPYYNPYDSNGNLLRTFDTYINGVKRQSVSNPLYDATLNTKNGSEYIDFTDNVYAEYQVIKPLKLVGRFGVETRRGSSEEFYPAEHSMFANTYGTDETILSKGTYNMSTDKYFKLSGDVSAQFNMKFNDAHDVFATAQYTIDESTSSDVKHYTEGFPNSRMSNITFARQYAKNQTPTGSESISRSLGVLLTVGYGYKDRYMFDGTIKGSASSVFGTNNRWGTFWSTGVAWNAHNEDFLKGASWLKQMKLRASVGTSGNQNYAATMSIPIYKYFSSAYYDGFTGATVMNMGNPNLGWESKMDWNVGIDFKTERLSLISNVYLCDTRNLVFNRSILPSTGFKSVSDNLGKVRNKGVEASVSYRIYQRGSSYFAIFGSIAANDNRILEISDALRNFNTQQQENAAENGTTAPVIQYYDGVPMNSIWVVPSLGIDPVSGKEIYVDKNGNLTNVWKATNLVNYGSSDPIFNGSSGVNGEINGVGINLACTFYGGGYEYNTTLVDKVENVLVSSNLDRRIFTGRWYYPGQEAQYRNGETSKTQATSRFVQRNNVFKISSASVYYEFPYKMISKIKMQRLRLTLYANDIYTFSSIRLERGTSYPYSRSFTFAVTATF